MPRIKRPSEVKEYQELVRKRLSKIFGEENVKKEWDVAKDSQDAYTRRLYCPKLDIAVGPFNIDGTVDENNVRIEEAVVRNKDFIDNLFQLSESSLEYVDSFLRQKNKNPRCLLAIEIEKSGSRKHMVGNIVNTSILGAFGIIIPFDDKALSAYRKIDAYLDFAAKVGKTREIFKNVLIINKENFLKAIFNSTPTLSR